MSPQPAPPPAFRIKPLWLMLMGVGMAVLWGGIMLGVDALGLVDGEPGVRNPWATIVLAMIMGVVFAFLWRRQMMRRFGR